MEGVIGEAEKEGKYFISLPFVHFSLLSKVLTNNLSKILSKISRAWR